jgi:hypothetical protein
MRMGELALHLQGRRRMLAHPLLIVKLDGNFRFDLGHIGKLQQKITLPAAAVIFAVGDDLEPEVFLHANHVPDRRLLNALELGAGAFVAGRGFARLDQVIGSNQASDMMRARESAGWQWHACSPWAESRCPRRKNHHFPRATRKMTCGHCPRKEAKTPRVQQRKRGCDPETAPIFWPTVLP